MTDQTKTPRTDAVMSKVHELLSSLGGDFTDDDYDNNASHRAFCMVETHARTLEREAADLRERCAELERDRCDTCGAKIYSGPPDCPTCGAPNCCQQCCKIDSLTQRAKRAEAELKNCLHLDNHNSIVEMLHRDIDNAEAERDAAYERCAKVCENFAKEWQEMTPKIISPVACAAADLADSIRALAERKP